MNRRAPARRRANRPGPPDPSPAGVEYETEERLSAIAGKFHPVGRAHHRVAEAIRRTLELDGDLRPRGR